MFRLTKVSNTSVLRSNLLFTTCYKCYCLSSVNVKNLLQHWTHQFRKYNVPEPKESAEYILAHVCGRYKTFSHYLQCNSISKQVTVDELERINALAEQRLKMVPIQYVLGEWDFCGLTLDMAAPVFIPRPETEELVGHVIKHVMNYHPTEYHVNQNSHNEQCISPPPNTSLQLLEIGCGTGAITLAIIHELQRLRRNVILQCTAVDIDEAACGVCSLNAQLVNIAPPNSLRVVHAGVTNNGFLVPLTENAASSDNTTYDIIVSNPPYIPSAELTHLHEQIIRYESRDALDGGHDGLDIVRNIIRYASDHLNEHGSLWLEVHMTHPDIIEHIVTSGSCSNDRSSLGYVATYKDFNGLNRFCHITKNIN